MRDVIRDAMTRPDCILGVVPDGGGMWLSPLRPDTPRNFAEKPEEWNDAMTAANQIGSDDWSFQIKMNVLSQIQQASGEIFNNDSGSPLKIYGDFFGIKDISDIEEELIGLRYEYQDILAKLQTIDTTSYFTNITPQEIAKAIAE